MFINPTYILNKSKKKVKDKNELFKLVSTRPTEYIVKFTESFYYGAQFKNGFPEPVYGTYVIVTC